MTLIARSRAAGRSVASPIVGAVWSPKYQLAGASAVLAGVAGLSATTYFGTKDLPASIVVLILGPALLGLALTRSVVAALSLSAISEAICGGSGHWIELGPLPVRAVILGAAVLCSVPWNLETGWARDDWTGVWAGLYGGILPLYCLAYSVLGRGTRFSMAFQDANAFFAVLLYFPMRALLYEHRDVLEAWLLGMCVAVSGCLLLITVGPADLAVTMFRNWCGTALGIGEYGFGRAAVVVEIVLAFSVIFGILQANYGRRARAWGLVLAAVTLAPFVLHYLRGPLISIFLVIGAIGMSRAIAQRRVMSMIGLLLILGLAGSVAGYVITTYMPEGVQAFGGVLGGAEEFAGAARVEQLQRLMEAFWSSPFFGKGFGVPLIGYERNESGLGFELQYPMLLYRMGAIAFAPIVVAVGWVFKRLVSPVERDEAYELFQRASVGAMAVILMAGATNPYLKTVYAGMFAGLALALRAYSFRTETRSPVRQVSPTSGPRRGGGRSWKVDAVLQTGAAGPPERANLHDVTDA